jgi:hypothetical protein
MELTDMVESARSNEAKHLGTDEMSDNRGLTLLQTFSHVFVVGAGVVYLLGFIVVSLFDASFGIADFSLFRTRVIAAGILFAGLAALQIVATFRMFAVFGLSVKHAASLAPVVSPKNRWLNVFDVVLSIPFTAVGIAWLVLFLFKPGFGWTPLGFGLFLVIIALFAAVGVWSQKHFDRFPWLFVCASLVASVTLLVVVFRWSSRDFFWLVVWLTLVGLFTLDISWEARTQDVRKTPWERLVFIIVPVVFGLYATKVFPNIRREYGGGMPVLIVLHLNKSLPPLESQTASVSLIDETELGYYVMDGSGKAVFVARNTVEDVEFVRSP